jgi:hypothetical protein
LTKRYPEEEPGKSDGPEENIRKTREHTRKKVWPIENPGKYRPTVG